MDNPQFVQSVIDGVPAISEPESVSEDDLIVHAFEHLAIAADALSILIAARLGQDCGK